MTRRRRTPLLAVIACAAVLMTGCQPTPGPTPSSSATGFATEAEAFAAAEATYRAYVDAVNARRDGRSAIDPADLLTGSALAAEIDGSAQLKKLGLHIEGPSRIAKFQGESFSATSVKALACVDATETRVIDESGKDVTPKDRSEWAVFALMFVTSSGDLLIADSESGEGLPCPPSA